MRALRVEIQKLSGSLALLLLLVVPALLSVIVLLAIISNPRHPTWQSIFSNFAFPIWAFFLLPMAITAFTTLLGNIEHRSGMWDHWLALPVARWRIFAAKAAVTFAAVAAMTALMVGFTLAAAGIGGTLSGRMPLGVIHWWAIGRDAMLIMASAAMLAALQLWVALRFQNFVVPLAVGICGTLIAIAVTMTRATQANYFPWVLPVRVLTGSNPVEPAMIGLVGGAVCMAIMIFSLQRSK